MLFLTATLSYAQEQVDKKYNAETGLVEATYYYENGMVSQQGTFDRDGKLHGQWTSFNEAGEKIAIGSYDRGVKSGTWYFWADNTLKEVEFSNNQIASVTEAKNSSGLANH